MALGELVNKKRLNFGGLCEGEKWTEVCLGVEFLYIHHLERTAVSD